MWHNDMYPVIHFGLTSILLPALFDVRPCKLNCSRKNHDEKL